MVCENLIVCICGSTRFREEMVKVNRDETLKGNIVLAPGVFGHSGDQITEKDKEKLDKLHFSKIDISSKIIVVCRNGYVGESTRKEIEYAVRLCKRVVFRNFETE